ncbi:hypothetical protein SETIT_6G211000v2 [Setaria italica]|uniref:DUF599 domain-containing protein n=1 Tax=Setaria italica TaxID=4555 RepID=K3YMN6_SETIT|nr:uncharacterized protein LOC101781536 [Setaria italica]RCV31852.1 hypothetical protein SETIT_6G211000v2 [Setaria italica]
MAWRESYMVDVVLIPLVLLFPVAYHLWLWRAVRHRPLRTIVGINAATCRLWVFAMAKDSEENALVVVHSLRNVIVDSTLAATAAVLLCTGVAAMLSCSSYAAVDALKCAAFLVVFLLACVCHTLAVCSLNQAVFLVNGYSTPSFPVSRDYVVGVLERGLLLHLAGNRVFYAGVPLLLWTFGPVLACLSSLGMVPILYNIDMHDHVQSSEREQKWRSQRASGDVVAVGNDVQEEHV